MKRIILFAILFVISTLSFAQSTLPTLSGYENLFDKGVALSDTAQEAKSFKFWMNSSVSTGNRYTKWDVVLSQSVTFPKGAKISANVMVPTNSGDVQVSATLLNGDVVVMNSALYVVSKNSGPGILFHRQNFQFPEIDGSFNKIRVNLSYLQNETGSRVIFFDGIYLINSTNETLVDDCNGGGTQNTKPGVTTLIAPANGATSVSITPTFSYAPVLNTTQYELQIVRDSDGSIVYSQKNAAVTVTATNPLAYNTKYSWRIKCWNSNTPSDTWSAVYSFTTTSQTITAPVFTIQPRPDNQNFLIASWVGGPVLLRLVTNPGGNATYSQQAVTSPYTFQNIADGDYLFMGKYVNPESDWSTPIPVRVNTIVLTTTPNLVSPANNSTGNGRNTKVVWNGTNVQYEISIAKNSAFTTDVLTYEVGEKEYIFQNLLPSTVYYWRVRAKSGTNYSSYSDTWNFMTVGVTGVDENNSLPTKFDLLQNYPNPFNPSTKISFSLPSSSPVTISFFDITGREVAQSVNQNFSGGVHAINFDGTKLSSGIYIYTISSKFGLLSKKMLLMK